MGASPLLATDTDGLGGKVAVVTGGASGIGRATVMTLVGMGATVIIADIRSTEAQDFAATLVSEGKNAHWCTILWSAGSDDLLMHPWSPPGHRHERSTFEVQHEFCGVRWPRTPRPATGLCAGERRSVSDRLRGPGTTGWLPTAATVRKPR